MQDKRIDGKKISEEIGKKLLVEITEKKLQPSLGILCVGNDPASLTFINVKKRFGERYGFKVNVLNLDLPDLNDYTDFKNKVIIDLKKLQEENGAVIVQLPLPENLKDFTEEILGHVEKEKDVDNLNNGKFIAPIVLALQKVLMEVGENLQDKVFGIVGLGKVVGQPIYNHLISQNFNVAKIGRENFPEVKKCDVIISGVGQANLIKREDIKKESILIDYGCSLDNGKFCGDFDGSCYEKSKFYTPVPGCMGPLVVACLFSNVLQSVVNKN